MIINLHGFNSAGNNNSYKALSGHFEPDVRVISPSYTVHHFTKGLAEIEQVLQHEQGFSVDKQPLFVGSSTGALYAETLAQKYQGRLVLINPVVDYAQLKPLIGPQKNYATELEYEFTQAQWQSFSEACVDLSLPRLIFIEAGDEKLDHRLTRNKFAGHASIYETDGDSHRFTHWLSALPVIQEQFF